MRFRPTYCHLFYRAVGLSIMGVLVAVGAQANVTPAYEENPVLQASEILPDYLLSSPVHTVVEEVKNDGTTNHYVVQSPLGDAEAAGRDELEVVIQELRALNLLQDAKKRKGAVMGFNQGVKHVATAPYHSVKRVVFDPLYAIEAVPSEIVDYAGKIATVSDLIKYGPKVFIRRSLGIDGARKDLARRLHVDVDTDNAALRDEIKRVGWGVWWGGLVPDAGEDYIDLTLDLSTEVGDIGDGNLGRAVSAIRREVFPRSARRLLKKLDVPKPLNKAFRKHPHYTDGMREDLAEALVSMESTDNRVAYIHWARGAGDKRKARQAVKLAQVLAVYHATERPMASIHSQNRGLLLQSEDGTAVVPLTYDHLMWNAEADQALQRAEVLNDSGAPMEVWSLGEFSPQLHAVLEARGYAARTQVDEAVPAFERPRKGLARLEQRYEKRVEEPIKRCFLKCFRPNRTQRFVLKPLGPGRPMER